MFWARQPDSGATPCIRQRFRSLTANDEVTASQCESYQGLLSPLFFAGRGERATRAWLKTIGAERQRFPALLNNRKLPLICPTRQAVFPNAGCPWLLCMGLFSIFWPRTSSGRAGSLARALRRARLSLAQNGGNKPRGRFNRGRDDHVAVTSPGRSRDHRCR